MTQAYPNTNLHIAGNWVPAIGGETIDVLNPASEECIGKVAHARIEDLDLALEAAQSGFDVWKKVSPMDRYKAMRKVASLLKERIDQIAVILTQEQGKPIQQSKGEIMLAVDIIDWFAEEGRRTYGRIIPARMEGVMQSVTKEPVGPVAGFIPWNFPINQGVRKIASALAAGCSIILKGAEETPASTAALVKCFADAGLPPGVVNLVYGVPSEISEYLISNPIIRKVTFTGSTAVGKQLASLAGAHMKKVTMELGGHAPAIVCEDADIDVALNVLVDNKFRNAGQVCVAPTRFLIHEKHYNNFVNRFTDMASKITVGDGMDSSNMMGPLAHNRRIEAMEGFVSDAISRGAKITTGGQRKGNKGYFFEPTVLTDVPIDARMMNEEPFGPLAPISSFTDFDSVIEEANRLDYGLASYAYTSSAKTAEIIGSSIESGMVSINHHGIALIETPFGGVKDSGYGSEGGKEGIEGYLNTKFISHKTL
ncbi:MAG: NAD-dependent succinate-semialdehyde dehydrogenase [Hyphomicrobiales bacterium]|jgi:succinate-semialdehyde dehydrogenase/glutarate-semialdehyde dehydrogenase|nr:NAD-dependent succinate-semialdehyde dehydrogenase [Hyphomicrobiales bacterium]